MKEKEGVGRAHFRGYAEALREKEGLVGKRLADWFSRMAATAAEPHEGLKAVEDLVRGITRIPFTTNRSLFGLPPGLRVWPRPYCEVSGV